MPDLEPWQVLLLIFIVCNVCACCFCVLVTLGGGAAVSTNPALQAGILVSTMTPNAQNVYSYFSNVTSNVSCLPLAANLAYISDLNKSIAISSGSCPSGTSVFGSANGITVCNPDSLYSNSMYTRSFNSWSSCIAGGSIDPRSVVWASGQSIQSAPFDTQAATTPFAKPPTGYSGTPNYTMSLDINVAETAPHWRNILAHQPANSTGDWNSSNARKPSVYVTGSDAPPVNRIHIVHQAGVNDNTNIVTTFAATPGTYFNLTWVVSGGTLKAYINGILDSTGTVSGAFTWSSPDQPWTWMHPNYAANKLGAITVANVYFWNTALTTDQIANLKIPSTPIPSVSTTSYYMPEPFSGTDIAGY